MAEVDSPRGAREREQQRVTADMLDKARARSLLACNARARLLGLGAYTGSHAARRPAVAPHVCELRRPVSRARSAALRSLRCVTWRQSPGFRILRRSRAARLQLLAHSQDLFILGNANECEYESESVRRLLGYSMLGCARSVRASWSNALTRSRQAGAVADGAPGRPRDARRGARRVFC